MKRHLATLVGIFIIPSIAFSNVIFSDFNEKLGVPDQYDQYKNFLSQSELQISDANGKIGNMEIFAKGGNFKDIVNQYFYVDRKSKALVFKMKNKHLRSELRVLKNFRTDLPNTYYKLSSVIKIITPYKAIKHSDSKLNEITFMQVHNKGTDNKGTNYIPHPLLRIVWKRESNGIKGHFWAVIKNNALQCKGLDKNTNSNKAACDPKIAYKRYDLGYAPKNEKTKFDISVGNKTLTVDVNGKQKVKKNISYWHNLLSYYKAGVYNQFTNGTSEVDFYFLSYRVSNSSNN